MRSAWVIALGVVAACGGKAPAKKIVKPEPVVEKKEPPPPPPPPEPLSLEKRLEVHGACFADFVGEKADLYGRCYTATSSEELVDSGQGPAVGPEAIAAASQPLWDAFTLQGEPRMVLASGEHALAISLLRGTQDAAFAGVEPAGKSFGVFLAEVMTLDDQGRHATVRAYMDLAGMAAQLGGGPKGAPVRKPYDATGRPAYQVIGDGGEVETANTALIQAAFDRFNQKDWKGLAAIYNKDAAIYEQIAADDTEGARAIGKYFAELGKAFPDAQQKVDDIWAAGDFVVAETTFTGTNQGASPTLGIKKATKKAVTVRRAHVFRFDAGKVIQHWVFTNGAALQLQLGLVAPPPAG